MVWLFLQTHPCVHTGFCDHKHKMLEVFGNLVVCMACLCSTKCSRNLKFGGLAFSADSCMLACTQVFVTTSTKCSRIWKLVVWPVSADLLAYFCVQKHKMLEDLEIWQSGFFFLRCHDDRSVHASMFLSPQAQNACSRIWKLHCMAVACPQVFVTTRTKCSRIWK